MATKKQRKTKAARAKKKKRNVQMFWLSAIVLIMAGFLVFFFLSLFDYVYPPITGKETASKTREKRKVELYFADSNERFLISETRFVPKTKGISGQAEELVKALLEGPKTGLVRTFPEGTTLHNIKVKNGTAYVSFDKNLVELHPGSTTSEITTIYSLTNTLSLNIKEISTVKLLINGKDFQSIKGHIDTRHPFTVNRELLARNST